MNRLSRYSRLQLIARAGMSLLLGGVFLPGVVGQITEATLQGRVTDSAGEILVSAPVTARNNATGDTRAVNTDANGNFRLASLTPGSYTVAVTVTGFSTYHQSALTLNVGRTTELNIKLEIGAVEETVHITTGADALAISREGRKP